MPKVRVYEISKELELTNKEVISAARQIGLELKSHASSVSELDAEKIKDILKDSSNGNGSAAAAAEQQDPEQNEEQVTVFKSDEGQEVVERRTGSRVVLRKKKRKIKVETEEELEAKTETTETAETEKQEIPVDEEKQIGEEIETTVTAKVSETEVIEPETAEAETEAADKAASQKVETEVTVEESETAAKEETAEIPDAEKADTDKTTETETKKSAKKSIKSETEEKEETRKKGKKVKPKKEEIIDEDTLEELRKVFRTKLPSRKKEFVIDDRRPKLKRNYDNKRRRPNNKNFTNKPDIQSDSPDIPSTLPPIKKQIKIGETITVGELAKLMSIKAGEVIKKLMSMGTPVTINESLDNETAVLIADEFGFEVEVVKFEEDELLFDTAENESAETFPRPPVVTVMGHVDHGKTTLLDTIREANVVEGEAGGITQHIGAYKVKVGDGIIVFVDTPGHEAFTSMRARGASITDIVILVVAADDGVMPQTVEAVNHAQAAGVPIIVAINKIDKEGADPDKLKRELSEIGLISEEWGGDTLFAEVSAKQKTGIRELLDLVLLQSDILELKAPRDIRANGYVIEAGLDKGRGAVSTVIVKEGTLKVGDYVLSGIYSGKVRALTDDEGKRVKSAGPSIPVEIMGLSGVPEAGEKFYVVQDEKTARNVITHREDESRAKDSLSPPKLTLDDLYDSLEKEEAKELNLIIKGDTQGSVEALRDAIVKLSTEKCVVKVVHTAVGGINETDVVLASASNAIIVGFNVRPDNNALSLSEKEGVSLELHTIIYDVVNRIKNAMEGLLEPIYKEIVTGHVEVKEIFNISRIGTIAGCMVSDGKVNRDDKVRVVRDGVVVFDGKISSLKRFKDDAKEVQAGYECGMSIENFNDIKVGDVFELYSFEEIKQQL